MIIKVLIGTNIITLIFAIAFLIKSIYMYDQGFNDGYDYWEAFKSIDEER